MLHSPFIILTRVWVFLRLMLSHFVCQKNLPPRNLDFTRPENVQQKKNDFNECISNLTKAIKSFLTKQLIIRQSKIH